MFEDIEVTILIYFIFRFGFLRKKIKLHALSSVDMRSQDNLNMYPFSQIHNLLTERSNNLCLTLVSFRKFACNHDFKPGNIRIHAT